MGVLLRIASWVWRIVCKILKFISDLPLPPGTNWAGLGIGLAILFAVYAPLEHYPVPRLVEYLLTGLGASILIATDLLIRKYWLNMPFREALFEFERGPLVVGFPAWMLGTVLILSIIINGIIDAFKG